MENAIDFGECGSATFVIPLGFAVIQGYHANGFGIQSKLPECIPDHLVFLCAMLLAQNPLKKPQWELAIDDYPLLKSVVPSVAYEEEHINEADQTDFAWPSLIIYQDFPRMNITIRSYYYDVGYCQADVKYRNTYQSHSKLLSWIDLPNKFRIRWYDVISV